MSGWDKLDEADKRGPGSLGRYLITLTAGLVLFAGVLFGGIYLLGNAAGVVHGELGAKALNEKYEYFKDASAKLDALLAGIEVQKGKLDSTKQLYGADATKWPEDVRERYSKADTEFRGMVLNFNNTASKYNSEMSKFHTSFPNAGLLPEGAKNAPRRDFREYRYE